jgi:glycosyltransferase involved in cell wall biosynthesis
MPEVSVIIPTYNCSHFLADAISSVLNQDYQDIELIVIDDGSTDDTTDMLINIKDSRLKIVHHENQGEQATVNRGLKLITGKYFVILNADDMLRRRNISTLKLFMDVHPDVLCAYPDWDAINEDGSLRVHTRTRDYDFVWMVRHHTCIPSVGSMFRSSVIRSVGFRDTTLRWLGDFDYWLRLGLVGKMARVPYTRADWRKRDGQASRQRNNNRAAEHVRVIEKFYSLPGITGELLKVKSEAVCWSWLVAMSVCADLPSAFHHLGKAIGAYPQLISSLQFWDMVRSRLVFCLRR